MADRTKYSKLLGAAGTHGSDYQLKLLTLFLLRGYTRDTEFWLSTENKNAGKFDDVVYETKKNSILLQAKHKQDPKKQLITFNDIFPSNDKKDEFNLLKYLDSFVNIKHNFSDINALVLCTNTNVTKNVQDEIQNYICPQLMTSDHIFYFSKEKTYYSFKINCKHLLNKNSAFSDVDIDAFLDKLQLVCVSDNDIDNEIKRLIEQIDILDESVNIEDLIYFITDKIKSWFQQSKGLYLTQQDVESYLAMFNSRYLIHKFKQHNLTFNFSQSDDKYSCHVIQNREYLPLHILKVYQNFEGGKVIILNQNDTAEMQEISISAFKSPEFECLIIMVVKETYKYLKKIIKDLVEKISAKPYKKITFITDEENILKQLENNLNIPISVYRNQINHESLSDESQKYIISKQIIFQNKSITLKELMEPHIEKIADILDEFAIFALLQNKLVINQNLSNDIINFYVPRRIRSENLYSKVLSEEDLCGIIVNEKGTKIILIVDGAGMGKTTILSSLQYLLNCKYNYWLIKINLNECTQYFKSYLNNSSSNDQEELFRSLMTPIVGFETGIFNLPQKVIVMLDAFDEISPDYTELVISLILTCDKTHNIRRIIITTRPHCQDQFKRFTNGLICSLYSFSEEDQIQCLSKYWRSELKLNDIYKCEIFAKILIEKLKNVMVYTSWNLIGIPLQSRLIADIFRSKCIDYINNDTSEIVLSKNLNLIRLYDMFIEERRKIYIDEKNHAQGIIEVQNVLNKMFDDAIQEHTKIALKVIFKSIEFHHFNILQTPDKVPEISLLRMGILQKNDTDLKFCHQTFAEYFVAQYIWKTASESDVKEEFLHFLIDTILTNVEYKTIQSFLETILEDQIISDKLMEMCGAVTAKINWHRHEAVLFLSSYGYYNLLKLMLEKCNDCRNILQVRNFEGYDLLVEGISNIHIIELLLKKGANILNSYPADYTLLHYAAAQNVEVVKFLINKGIDVNIKNLEGETPLHLAVGNSLLNIADILIANGAYIDIKNIHHESLLHYAAKSDSIAIFPLLIENGLAMNAQNLKGETPLHVAITENSLNIAEILIANGADINIKTNNDESMLHYTIKSNNVSMISLLIEHGIDINSQNINGETPLHLAVVHNLLDVALVLIDYKADINIKNFNGESLLHYAIKFDNLDIIPQLIESEIDINTQNSHGETPLHLAVRENLLNIIKILFDHKADVNIKNNLDESILHYAAKYDVADLLPVFLEYKVDINDQNLHGETPLHIAAENHSFKIFKLIVANKANMNIKNNYEESILHYTAKYNAADILPLLIAYEVDINSQNSEGETALHLAVENNSINFVNILIDNKADINIRNNNKESILHYAAKFDEVDVFSLLIEKGLDINAQNSTGQTPLHLAAAVNSVNIINLLVDKKVDINIKSNNGESALHYAVSSDSIDIVSLLIEEGTCINDKNQQSRTPFLMACLYETFVPLCYLIDIGCDIRATDSEGHTALHILAMNKYIDYSSGRCNILLESDINCKPHNILPHKVYTQVVKKLIEENISVNDVCIHGMTALQYAVKNNKHCFVSLLTNKIECDTDIDTI